MIIQRKEKKKFFIFLMAFLIIAIISLFSRASAMKDYEELNFTTGMVTASTLNVRQGPALTYKVISKIHKNEYVRVFAKIGNWYVVQTDNDVIGAVYSQYIKAIYSKAQETVAEEVKENIENQNIEETMETSAKPVEDNNTIEKTDEIQNQEANIVVSNKVYSSELTKDENEVLDLINKERENVGLDPLKIDDDLQNVCRLKAKEMEEKGYFDHQSPTYGTPFEMMKKNGISYKVAGENIAGNTDNKKAVDAWMNSENHKANIINKSYNYTGIAVVNSQKYGKIYVQMFIGR